MKFLTPDLLARFQSEDETTVLRAARRMGRGR